MIRVLIAMAAAALCCAQEPVKIGIVGLDTSDVTRFTSLLNDAKTKEHIRGGLIVAVCKDGSAAVADIHAGYGHFDRALYGDHGISTGEESLIR